MHIFVSGDSHGFLDQRKVQCSDHVCLVQDIIINCECSGDSGVLTEIEHGVEIIIMLNKKCDIVIVSN